MIISGETLVTTIPYCIAFACAIALWLSLERRNHCNWAKGFFIDPAIPARQPHKAIGSIRVVELNC
jgi:hypothetical protein